MELLYSIMKLLLMTTATVVILVVVYYFSQNWKAVKDAIKDLRESLATFLENQEKINQQILTNVETQTGINKAVKDNIIEMRQYAHENNANLRELQKIVERHDSELALTGRKIKRIAKFIRIPPEELEDGTK